MTGSLEEKQIKPRWRNWVPALAVHQSRVGVCAGRVGCDPQPLGQGVVTAVNWDKCVMAQAGSVTSRRGEWQEGLSCPSPAPQPGSRAGSGPEDVLWCLQGMFTQLERTGRSQVLWMWHFQRGFSLLLLFG